MMKIRYALLLSVSCLGLGSLAHAGLTPDITPVGKNTFIFTHTSNDIHLASQSKLLSASVIARRTSSDEAIHNNINGSPRRINSPRDDNSDNFLSTHPVLPYQGKERCGLSPVFPLLIERVRVSRNISQHKELEASRLLLPKQDTADRWLTASVCFITDAGNCRSDDFGGAGMDNPNSSGGDNPEWDLDNKERCNKEGYTLTSCSSVQDPVNYCPYDNHFFERCECKPNLVTCTKPYYGVGESCGGKYASCKLDNARACKEDGYTQTGSCNSVQNINKRCPYDSNYFDKCVCRSDLYTCSSPLQGVGTACGGKYASCQCPSSYKSCECGKASGAKSCNWNGTTKYSSCKACCSDTCPSGSKSVSCSSSQNKVRVSTTECGSACYSCQAKHSHSYSCPSGYSTSCSYGYSSTTSKRCSCGATSGTCYKCKSAPSYPSSSSGGSLSSSSSSGSGSTPNCNCSGKTPSPCPSDAPYQNGETKDQCGNTCSYNCYNAKTYFVAMWDDPETYCEKSGNVWKQYGKGYNITKKYDGTICSQTSPTLQYLLNENLSWAADEAECKNKSQSRGTKEYFEGWSGWGTKYTNC